MQPGLSGLQVERIAFLIYIYVTDIISFISVYMACLVKIFLAFFIVQVAMVLAKPYEQENDDRLYRSQSDTGNFERANKLRICDRKAIRISNK